MSFRTETEPFNENSNKTKPLIFLGTNKPLNHGLTVRFGLSRNRTHCYHIPQPTDYILQYVDKKNSNGKMLV